ncbi:MAG: lactate racemase [Chloroflexota bacterium]|nr:lactate racemase [Chloroflexota bacterium]
MAAWYGDALLELPHPPGWTVETHLPSTPPPLAHDDLVRALEHPVGQAPIRELAAGRRRPLIIVDDLTRPTPADLVIPIVLRHLADAGIPAPEVRILLGTGAHGPAPLAAVARKVGREAAASCRLISHDARRNSVPLGRTSYGSPVLVDREVARSDLLIGIGGVYPQHSVGFGGGSKLVLGALGRRSIVSLHYGHPSMAGSLNIDNDFRRDLDEMSALIGLRTLITMHVDADRRPVRIVAGDHLRFYREAVEFSRTRYRAPAPGDADVVLANAYPMDVSLTFARSKALAALAHAGPAASRVLVAACPEGLGHHALFPFLNGPRLERQRHMARKLSVVRPATVPGKVIRRGARLVRRGTRPAPDARPVQGYAGEIHAGPHRPVLLHAPAGLAGPLPAAIPGMELVDSWEGVLARIAQDHPGRTRLRVAVYPCGPLHCLDTGEEEAAAPPAHQDQVRRPTQPQRAASAASPTPADVTTER